MRRGKIIAAVGCWLIASLATPARARSLERARLHVDLSSGETKTVWSATGRAANESWPRPRWSAGIVRADLFQTIDRSPGVVTLESGLAVARDPKRSIATKIRLPPSDRRIIWAVVLDDIVVLARPLTDRRSTWIGAALDSGRVLWRRDRPTHDRPGVSRVGSSRLVVNTPQGVELVDAKTGATIRRLARIGEGFAAVDAGDVQIVEAGKALYAIDQRSGAVRWTLQKRGRVVSWLSLRAGGRAVLRTDRSIALLDTREGRVIWRAAVAGRDPIFFAGDRVLVLSVERSGRSPAVVRLRVWRRRDGALLATHVVQRYRRFFDSARAEILGARDGHIELETTWIVLD